MAYKISSASEASGASHITPSWLTREQVVRDLTTLINCVNRALRSRLVTWFCKYFIFQNSFKFICGLCFDIFQRWWLWDFKSRCSMANWLEEKYPILIIYHRQLHQAWIFIPIFKIFDGAFIKICSLSPIFGSFGYNFKILFDINMIYSSDLLRNNGIEHVESWATFSRKNCIVE